MKVFLGFERQPVERPAKRWVVVSEEAPTPTEKRTDTEPEPAAAVESQGQNPAA
jgi:hypothetical protein